MGAGQRAGELKRSRRKPAGLVPGRSSRWLHGAPVPLAETIAVNWMLGLASLDVFKGAATIGVSGGELSAGGFSERSPSVPWGRAATAVLAIASGKLLLLRCADAIFTPASNIAREPRDELFYTNATPLASALLPHLLGEDALSGAMIRLHLRQVHQPGLASDMSSVPAMRPILRCSR